MTQLPSLASLCLWPTASRPAAPSPVANPQHVSLLEGAFGTVVPLLYALGPVFCCRRSPGWSPGARDGMLNEAAHCMQAL